MGIRRLKYSGHKCPWALKFRCRADTGIDFRNVGCPRTPRNGVIADAGLAGALLRSILVSMQVSNR